MAVTTPGLKRELGGWTTTAVVIGNMIGSGVFLLLAAVFASLGRAYPRTGGPYVYVRQRQGQIQSSGPAGRRCLSRAPFALPGLNATRRRCRG